MHPSSLARTTSMPTLEVVPPIVPSRISTKEKSKIASQFSLGHVAPFVVDLRGKAVAMHVLVVMGPSGPTLSLHIEGIPMQKDVHILYMHLDRLGICKKIGLKDLLKGRQGY
jgi:hypothetical protein